MPREIVFRAWHKQEKKMYQPVAAIQSWNQTIWLTRDYIQTFEAVEIMQFTGLLDKHGKEIYEGDILKIVGNKRGPIVSECGCFGYYDLSKSFVILSLKQGNYSAKESDREIIGSIHTTPELFKDK